MCTLTYFTKYFSHTPAKVKNRLMKYLIGFQVENRKRCNHASCRGYRERPRNRWV